MVRAAVGSAAELYFSQGITQNTAKRYNAAWKKHVTGLAERCSL